MTELGPQSNFNPDLPFRLIAYFQDCCQVSLYHSGTKGQHAMPEDYHTIDWLLGVRYDQNAICPSQGFKSPADAFLPNKWAMGYIGYEYRQSLWQAGNRLAHKAAFEDFHFFEPETIILAKNQKIFASGDIDKILYIVSNAQKLPFDTEISPIHFNAHINEKTYSENFAKIKKDILNGRFYELNYCMPFVANQSVENPQALFTKLQKTVQMPFANFTKIGNKYLIGASPERFLKKTDRKLLSQPIKGTAPIQPTPIENKQVALNLSINPKERAENVMIVDLVRNDLARSCLPGTVKVSHLFEVFQFQNIMQMISGVSGELMPNISGFQALEWAFPMGSMTGAPKIEVMKAISEYENVGRGVYSGTIGYIEPNGNFDFNVVIRSLQVNNDLNFVDYHVGSAITWDAEQKAEYQECLLKAKQWEKVF